jgi:hypothetical protein
MKTYVATIGEHTPWAHYNGAFYVSAKAPAGAYPLTREEYTALNYRVALGEDLHWHPDQRPYAVAEWTQPTATGYTLPDGARISASSEDTAQNYAWRAMNGATSGGNGNFWAPSTTEAWWTVVFPYALELAGLLHYNRGGSTQYVPVYGRYWTDSSMQTPIGNAFELTGVWSQLQVYDGGPPIVTNRIYFQKTGGSVNGGIGQIFITAKKISYEVPE